MNKQSELSQKKAWFLGSDPHTFFSPLHLARCPILPDGFFSAETVGKARRAGEALHPRAQG